MADQFQNPQTTKLENETEQPESASKKVERMAEKLAKKPAKTEQSFDQENGKLFSK